MDDDRLVPIQERCASCGGELEPAPSIYRRRREHTLYFRQPPIRVCTNCGEVWVDGMRVPGRDIIVPF